MSSTREQRKLAAIMFTDMVGYSALSQRDDKLALELLEEHRQLLREIFPRFNGAEIKTIGDAFLVEFNSALEAAQCAIEIQRSLAKRNADAPAERQVELKIGIHIGDVVHRGGDVYGDGVNIASRIEPLAGAGGICVSMDVERQIRNAVETRFEKLEPTELKNISVAMDLFRIVLPWERPSGTSAKSEIRGPKSERGSRSWIWATAPGLVLLVLATGWWWSTHHLVGTSLRDVRADRAHPNGRLGETSLPVPDKSIAVLPFDNLSSDKENAYFAEGIQDEILTRLAKVADLKVISRTSTQRFKSAPADLREIAKQLGVANILEGSVQKSNDQVRVNVQLINALTDAHLWADIYDRKLTDLFSVESDVAKTIADTLQVKLTGSEKRAMASHPTENTEAYQLYLQGLFFWNKRTAGGLRRAIELFNEAISKDPGFARAYAGVAQALFLLPAYNGGTPAEFFPKAKAAAERALSLDDTSSEAHAVLAGLKATFEFDFAGSIPEFERAIQLDPNDATAHQWFGNDTLADTGQRERELSELKRAADLDPLSLVINTNLGLAYLHNGELDRAVAQLRKTVAMDANFYYGVWNLGLVLELKGDMAGAIAQEEKAVAVTDDPVPLGVLGRAYALIGRKEEAQRILDKLLKRRSEGYIDAYALAIVYHGLDDRDNAMRWLEQGYQDRDGFDIGAIRVDPVLNSLHGDPRFEALAEKIVPAAQFQGARKAAGKTL
jgi:adenylate cyclase